MHVQANAYTDNINMNKDPPKSLKNQYEYIFGVSTY